MANHVIELDPLDPFSVIAAGLKYRRIMRQFDQKVDEFLERLAERGKEVLGELGYTPDGGEITVTVEPIDNGYMINAAGKGVVFLEFGAGDTVNSGNMYAAEMPFDVASGSYSEANDGLYAITRQVFGQGWWEFGGVKYTEIMPRNGMQTVYETLMQEWREIAKEVFA